MSLETHKSAITSSFPTVMEQILATSEKKVLVNLVKLVQQRRLEGEKGGWKEFLNDYDKQAGSSLSDPSRRSKDVLVAFLATIKKQEDLQLLARVLRANPYMAEESPDETAEERLVRMTLSHDKYPLDYLFPSDSEDWLVTGTGKNKSEAMKSSKIEMVAIDCEMVECEDGSDAVVRVAAVDRDLKVLLDEFVKPDQPVVDYRTEITGLTAEDVENANSLSLVDIQEKLQMFISEDTILVGQSLNHDLKVLKVDHARVIDTSLVFKFNYPSTRKPRNPKLPSLNYLCKSILGYAVQKDGVPHSCVDDAAAAMKLVLAIIEKGVETLIPVTKEMLEAEKSKLYLHKIPHDVPSEELIEAMTTDFTPKVKPSKRQGSSYYSAIVVFSSSKEANQAFENIAGDLGKDSSGLLQKQVFLKPCSDSGSRLYFHVRKMIEDDCVEEISATKRSYPEEKKASRKKQKRENDSEETREEKTEEKREKLREGELMKEIEELKQKLEAKDQIIDNLRKQLKKKKKKSR